MAAEIRVDTITSRSGINTLSFIGDGFAFLTNVGIGTTITTNPVDASNTQKLAVGVVTANQVYSSTVNVGTGVTLYGSTGIVSATKFYGDGSSLTGAGSTVINDNTTNSTYYPLFTQTTSGTVTSSGISTTKLSFNPSTGTLSATNFVGDGSGLTGAGSTVANDTTTNSTFYPLFTSTTSGTVTASKVSTTKLSFNPSTGRLTAIGFATATGTSNQFLKADGSSDATAYVNTGKAIAMAIVFG